MKKSSTENPPSFAERLQQRRELREYLKKESIYKRITKPYREAESYLTQHENYTRYGNSKKDMLF